MEPIGNDPTGFVAECVLRMLAAGFDADAFETAKWAGVACLIALGLSAVSGFAARVWKGSPDIAPPFSDNQFRWLLYVEALLIALPVATKVTTDTTGLEFSSSDRAFAQDVCRDQQQNFAQSAVIGALEAKIDKFGSELAEVRRAAQPDTPTSDPTQDPQSVITQTIPEILGKAVSILYRSARSEDTQVIADILANAGAGVARRATDLSETAAAQTAQRRDIYLLSDTRAGAAAQTIAQELDAAGYRVTQNVTLGALSGTAIQILLY